MMRTQIHAGTMRLLLVGLLVSACSSSSAPSGSGGAGGASATNGGAGGSVGTGGTSATNGGAGGGTGGSAADAGNQPPGAVWCPGYQESADQAGWVSIDVVLQSSVEGGMTSPIQSCQVGATDWSVTAAGTERDGIDETTMSFKIAGTYKGPGYYRGTLAQGISGSFSHDDLGSQVYASVASSDCELCINQDGLSGTVNCWDLEATVGTSTAIAYIDMGQFKCPNAQAKPAAQPTVPPPQSGVGGIPSGAIVCHYLDKLDCPGRADYATCVKKSDTEVLVGQCYGPWEQWLPCANLQPPSDYRCGRGDDLEMASGACATELAAARKCRDAVAVMASPECDALCAKAQDVCGAACDRPTFCEPYDPHCAASKLDWLRCAVQGSAVTCGTGGHYVVLGCNYNDSLCPG